MTSYEFASNASTSRSTPIKTSTQVYFYNSESGKYELLENVIIPENVEIIKPGSFVNISTIRSVSIPNSVTEIGRFSFLYCEMLEKVTFEEGSTISTIYHSTFDNCHELQTINIPSSVKTIEKYAFTNCVNLYQLDLSNVKKIDSEAFSYCTTLRSVKISDLLYSSSTNSFNVSSDAFYNCTGMIEVINNSGQEIAIGSSTCGYIAKYAKFVKVNEQSGIVNVNGFNFYTINGTHYLLNYVGESKEIVLPDYYNNQEYEIYRFSFYSEKYISITIPNTIKKIGAHAFFSKRYTLTTTYYYNGTLEQYNNITFADDEAKPHYNITNVYGVSSQKKLYLRGSDGEYYLYNPEQN